MILLHLTEERSFWKVPSGLLDVLNCLAPTLKEEKKINKFARLVVMQSGVWTSYPDHAENSSLS